MFSQACVKNSIHRGGGVHPPGQTPPEQTPPLYRHPRADTPPHPPGQMATAADGTHPTGMHSCYQLYRFFTLGTLRIQAFDSGQELRHLGYELFVMAIVS